MWRRVICIIFTVVLLPASLATALERPPAPDGFSWKRISELKAAFLIPDGWHYKREAKGGTLAFFITAENIDKTGRFETGLTINVLKNLKDREAQAYAKAFAAESARQHEALRQWDIETGVLHGFGVVARQAAHDQVPAIVMSTLAIGNSRTNTLYLLFFESLEPQWESAWKKGEKILEFFILDDEV